MGLKNRNNNHCFTFFSLDVCNIQSVDVMSQIEYKR
jgi:hypothetical protein